MIIDTTIYAVEPYKILPTSYLHTLLSHNISTPTSTSHDPFSFPQVINDELDAPTDPNIFIPLSLEEKERIYKPWQHAVIIKLYGQKIGHQLLRQKIYVLWKPTENLHLIDLGSDFYLLKFQKEENKIHAI